MKNKFIIFTLCFTLFFSGLNFRKVDAFSPVIPVVSLSSNVVASIGTFLVMSGVKYLDYKHLNTSIRDVYETKGFKEDILPSIEYAVSQAVDGVVTFGNDVVNWFNDVYFPTVSVGSNLVYSSIPCYEPSFSESSLFNPGGSASSNSLKLDINPTFPVVYGTPVVHNIGEFLTLNYDGGNMVDLYYGDNFITQINVSNSRYMGEIAFVFLSGAIHSITKTSWGWSTSGINLLDLINSSLVHTWDNVGSLPNVQDKDKEIALPLPGNLDSLVGVNGWNPSSDKLLNPGENVKYPSLDNALVDVTDSIVGNPSVPSNPSVPNEGILSTIKDFIISLVVPNDAFWTDTWGGLYNNFTSSFPMVDMDGFNDLVTGEKKFPNIDIDIMGVSGRVVNGDVINSIVDWLRPIIAGFMMLCLMLFNYRKIYKLIRNTEPFGGIAPGTSDFNTGISEYTHVGLVNDGFKRSEEEEFARSRYYEEMHFRNGGKL